MSIPINSGEFQRQAARVEEMVERVSALPDENARAAALELLQSVMDLHGTVTARIVEVLEDSGESGRSAMTKLGKDPLVCGLLVLYGLHPLSLEDRVSAAMEGLVPRLNKQGGSAELLGITDGSVRVSVHSSGEGCHSSPDALKATVEEVLLQVAPEAVEIIVEGVPAMGSGFVPLDMLQSSLKEEKKYEESAA